MPRRYYVCLGLLIWVGLQMVLMISLSILPTLCHTFGKRQWVQTTPFDLADRLTDIEIQSQSCVMLRSGEKSAREVLNDSSAALGCFALSEAVSPVAEVATLFNVVSLPTQQFKFQEPMAGLRLGDQYQLEFFLCNPLDTVMTVEVKNYTLSLNYSYTDSMAFYLYATQLDSTVLPFQSDSIVACLAPNSMQIFPLLNVEAWNLRLLPPVKDAVRIPFDSNCVPSNDIPASVPPFSIMMNFELVTPLPGIGNMIILKVPDSSELKKMCTL